MSSFQRRAVDTGKRGGDFSSHPRVGIPCVPALTAPRELRGVTPFGATAFGAIAARVAIVLPVLVLILRAQAGGL
jgi:hypothetical protein